MSEHWVRNHRRARKEHSCMLCHRAIGVGETYLRGVHFDGGAYSWKECAHCEALFSYLTHLWGEYEYSEDMVDEWEVESVGQARIKALWKMRWRRRDGALHPTPRVVKALRLSSSGYYRTVTGITLTPEPVEEEAFA